MTLYSPIVRLGSLSVNKQQTMQCFSIMITRDRFFISGKKNYGFESSLRIILYVMFSNSQKSPPRNSQNFGVIIAKQNLHYLRFKIVVDCKSDEQIKIPGRRGKETGEDLGYL